MSDTNLLRFFQCWSPSITSLASPKVSPTDAATFCSQNASQGTAMVQSVISKEEKHDTGQNWQVVHLHEVQNKSHINWLVLHGGKKANSTILGLAGQLAMNNRILCPSFMILLSKSIKHMTNKLVAWIHMPGFLLIHSKLSIFLNHHSLADFRIIFPDQKYHRVVPQNLD